MMQTYRWVSVRKNLVTCVLSRVCHHELWNMTRSSSFFKMLSKKHPKCWIFKSFETWYGQLNSFSLRKIIISISNTLFEHFQLAENIPFRPSQPCLYVVLSVENIRAWDVFNKMPEPKLESKSRKSVLAFATNFLQYNRKK